MWADNADPNYDTDANSNFATDINRDVNIDSDSYFYPVSNSDLDHHP
jgi:hypothetical protein